MIPKIKKINLGTQLMDTMISLIENGTWKAGEKLPNEIELANSFSVSRNIMRESMKILENFGILDSKTGIGTYISDNAISNICNMRFFESLKNNTSIEKLLETRLIIEPELAYYATLRATDEEIETLKIVLEEDTKKHLITNFFHTDDFHFHLHVAKYARNDILENLLTTILEQLSADAYGNFNKFVDNSVKIDSFNDHMAVFGAIQKRDPLLAKEIMYHHLFARMKVINPDYGTNLIYSEKIRNDRLKEN
ncbi:FadR/GntR family transcriptional regulator [Anaerotignum sp.]|uniref:FadR/GntR family transcriptional regulator n=1 Tax=Anaerotignum sp. TaxID=2039241 RepID=UPI003322B71A